MSDIEKVEEILNGVAYWYSDASIPGAYEINPDDALEALNQLIREETHKAQIETALDLHVLAQLSDKETFLEQVEKRIEELKGAGE